ncbi:MULTISPECIES: cysteine desulfurase family protein [unclassified Mesorhizobium]|uniref:cysteine desulfurase family protein n=1 Tax=unclassified Mesorhizobium TaxID=325217 RepID=UPI000FCC1FDD|nr:MULTISPECIES: cysteine desulfurase family protein [unclassified Mesorhizobium]RUV92679.1 cysteine desulfurase [Mesorhizobium sp. M1A.F.Ca.IN.020.04.1.1]RUW04388.1 cysteine desulfurase [Mesorhizobium sp. M1A.F.Ca.IN.020.03.1.1]RWH18395.1 MAG: cysteine desulfurase [Mesorhizobium sp.]RWH40294.1 MAG: cysteine desulfurase [Mesorhizobium sp.]TIR57695.1 MAG: cysteine desulfurase [Mesorhizobium sp.]
MHTPIYLDGHSTNPLAPEALEAMSPWWHAQAGNPHSPHLAGMLASQAVENARSDIASLIGSDPQELVFTSGATEANNIAIRGTALAALEAGIERREIVVSAIEHKSVLSSASSLRTAGFRIIETPVDESGVIDISALERLVGDQTLLVSVMAVNNEVGSAQPLADVVRIARAAGALVHVDAAQGLGKVSLNCTDFDFASLSSHKMYGPMGIGGLFVSSAAAVRPLPVLFGGGQETGIRPGTVPTPLVVGFGAAAKVSKTRLGADAAHSRTLSALFLEELLSRQVQFTENVPEPQRVPGSLSLRFPGNDAMSIIARAGNRIAISEGSACTSGQITASHVLMAMGFTPQQASETVRLYFGRYNSAADAAEAAVVLSEIVGR